MTKPCTRTGCTNQIHRALLTPSQYAKRQYCSNRCAARARYDAGWKPPQMTPEQRRVIGREGGFASGENRRRRAALRVSAYLARYLSPAITAALSGRDVTLLKVLFARAFNDGHRAGRSAGRMRPPRKVAA